MCSIQKEAEKKLEYLLLVDWACWFFKSLTENNEST